ncbi:glycosyltransferase [Sulfolobus acidocaldarius]|uniref:Glycosyl transferase family 1 domain-containing protein n=4 Tax=Sulfolobus acidocaldarius TaxID=2285 RepID=Q4J7K5_SULAC|nr:glycosyltransferase [Sulfolobus acidocaldarius]AAY81226.1 hypothetical protein Saci_1923 [Sulfolobus acidocaldarius DSM 639]AGE71848.1 hypothetical protein SacN8_09445 [Sulfolobus acidocaldarius N8]AGE74120.1 hypothetical protein SacRon12I_09465 [Sulfolobus acidocaldarius Ron12/I]ALU29966.1 hypothetical protein ATY89_08480 [Sulfolobus acidocaldarius]ALU32708.1 hypothetical protein ATZ20_11485 [Sulfolobus acidocaldarius]
MSKRGIIFIEEFTRLGGGQIAFINIYNAIMQRFDYLLLYTDKFHPKLPKLRFDRVFEGKYTYSENDPLIVFPIRMFRERRLLKKFIEKEKRNVNNSRTLFVFNNHPNVFVYNGTLNLVHENFLTPFTDENGNIRNWIGVKLLKLSGIYKEYEKANLIVTGNYARKMVSRSLDILGVTPNSIHVINLPVKMPENVELDNREECVLIFGRINREKKLDVVIEIAKRSRYRFIVAGAVNKGDESYFNSLRAKSPDNVNIIPNPNEENKDILFRKCSVFLQTKRYEHYGLSVAEAISYGLIPVVPKVGGPWEDITEYGKYGFGYEDIEEAISAIGQVMKVNPVFRKEVFESRYRFSFDRFHAKLNELLDKFLM